MFKEFLWNVFGQWFVSFMFEKHEARWSRVVYFEISAASQYFCVEFGALNILFVFSIFKDVFAQLGTEPSVVSTSTQELAGTKDFTLAEAKDDYVGYDAEIVGKVDLPHQDLWQFESVETFEPAKKAKKAKKKTKKSKK